jgi:hypothetical protein
VYEVFNIGAAKGGKRFAASTSRNPKNPEQILHGIGDHSTFSLNRDRLFDETITQRFFEHTVLLAQLHDLVSGDHFSVDGTLLEAWASHRASGRRTATMRATAATFVGRSAAMTPPSTDAQHESRAMQSANRCAAQTCLQDSLYWGHLWGHLRSRRGTNVLS